MGRQVIGSAWGVHGGVVPRLAGTLGCTGVLGGALGQGVLGTYCNRVSSPKCLPGPRTQISSSYLASCWLTCTCSIGHANGLSRVSVAGTAPALGIPVPWVLQSPLPSG